LAAEVITTQSTSIVCDPMVDELKPKANHLSDGPLKVKYTLELEVSKSI
jgi:hypothetical protein